MAGGSIDGLAAFTALKRVFLSFISYKRFYKRKSDSNGSIEQHKDQTMTLGFTLEHGAMYTWQRDGVGKAHMFFLKPKPGPFCYRAS